MRRVLSVFVVLLAVSGFAASLSAQEVVPANPLERQESDFRLEGNYPNPFNPETTIPFVLDEDLFSDGGSVMVTMRVFNILQQYIATPTALNHPGGDRTPIQELPYTSPGRYEAFWDGRDGGGREVASGVYFLQLVVDGRAQVRKMMVAK